MKKNNDIIFFLKTIEIAKLLIATISSVERSSIDVDIAMRILFSCLGSDFIGEICRTIVYDKNLS